MWFQSWGREDPLEEGTATTPVFLPEKFHEQRILAGYSLWDHKESDATEHTCKEYRNTFKKDTCTPIFIAALITIGKIWKQPQFGSVTQSCPTLCDPKVSGPPNLTCGGDHFVVYTDVKLKCYILETYIIKKWYHWLACAYFVL